MHDLIFLGSEFGALTTYPISPLLNYQQVQQFKKCSQGLKFCYLSGVIVKFDIDGVTVQEVWLFLQTSSLVIDKITVMQGKTVTFIQHITVKVHLHQRVARQLHAPTVH